MPQKGKAVVRKAGGAIARTARKVTTKAKNVTAKLGPRKRAAAQVADAPATKPVTKAAKPKGSPATPRPVQRQSDIPLDLIAAMYSPSQTSMKTSFRSDGADRQEDQELPLGGGDRWQDEDHFTNKSGDARIGTHGRSDTPGEKRR